MNQIFKQEMKCFIIKTYQVHKMLHICVIVFDEIFNNGNTLGMYQTVINEIHGKNHQRMLCIFSYLLNMDCV